MSHSVLKKAGLSYETLDENAVEHWLAHTLTALPYYAAADAIADDYPDHGKTTLDSFYRKLEDAKQHNRQARIRSSLFYSATRYIQSRKKHAPYLSPDAFIRRSVLHRTQPDVFELDIIHD